MSLTRDWRISRASASWVVRSLGSPGVSPLGKVAIFRSCEAKSNLARRRRPTRRTGGSTSERWRPATDGARAKSSVGRDHRQAVSGGTKGSASLRSLKGGLHLSIGCRAWAALPRRVAARKQWLVLRMPPRARARRSLHFLECSRGAPLWRNRCGRGVDQSLSFFGSKRAPVAESAAGGVAHGGSVATEPALRREELVLGLVERFLATIADQKHNAAAPSEREARRVIDAVRLVEFEAARPIAAARPRGDCADEQVPLPARLSAGDRRDALSDISSARECAAPRSSSLRSRRPVLAIALDSRFGDLSTFNQRFRAAFGATRTQYRASQH